MSRSEPMGRTFVRTELLAEAPPPANMIGLWPLLRERLFSSWTNIALTVFSAAIILLLIPPLIRFMFIDAVWTGENREACLKTTGACWPFIWAKFGQFIYGFYPHDLRWRPNTVFAVMIALLAPLLVPSAPFKKLNAFLFFGAFPIFAFIMLTGGDVEMRRFLVGRIIDLQTLVGPRAVSGIRFAFWVDYLLSSLLITGLVGLIAGLIGSSARTASIATASVLAILGVVLFFLDADFGLQPVGTRSWGGLLVTLVVALTGIVASLPLGILLALGRRSEMPIVRFASVTFIEFWRGVPLVTVLFFATYMLPLFLPEGVNFDGLLRALVGVTLFASAYMAEVVRGGLQAIPKGQVEGASALGLGYWQTMGHIVLPQALVLVIPGIVNSFIALFKDTTLVLIVSIFDLLGQLRSAFSDPAWATPQTLFTGFAFTGVIYFVFCYGMSRYSLFLERRAARSKHR